MRASPGCLRIPSEKTSIASRISVREFDRAIEDLSHAAALVQGEPTT